MINQSVVFGQFKGRVLPADGLIYTACLSVSDFIVVMFHTENIANCDTGGNRWRLVMWVAGMFTVILILDGLLS